MALESGAIDMAERRAPEMAAESREIEVTIN